MKRRLVDTIFLALICVPTVAIVRLGLTVMPYSGIRRAMTAIGSHPSRHGRVSSIPRVVWGVTNAARIIPGATCLTQAIAGRYLLARLGRESRIRIGVAKNDQGEFVAHAWLLCRELPVLGGAAEEVAQYHLLTEFGPQSS